MTERKSSVAKNIGIGVAVIVIVVVAFAAIYVLFLGGGKPAEVFVSGSVTTVGTLTGPQKITFQSMHDGKTYVASATSGSYSISLPNRDSYWVTITWQSLGITGGNADAGTLNLDTAETAITRNWSG